MDFLSAPSNFLVQWFRNFESKDLGPRFPSLEFSCNRYKLYAISISQYWVAPLVQCYLFSGGAFVFYVFLRVAGHRLDHRMSSLNAFRVEEPIEQVPLHKW